jgi:hypothetical protein
LFQTRIEAFHKKLQAELDATDPEWRSYIHMSDAWADERVWVIKPDPSESATDQAALIAKAMPLLCAEVGANLSIWDTITATTREILPEVSGERAKAARTEGRKALGKRGKFANYDVPPQEARFIMQDTMRLNVRDVMIKTKTFNMIHILHQDTAKKVAGRDSKGDQIMSPTAHGCNAGGPGSVELYGTEFSAVHRIFVEGGQRKLQLNQATDKQGVPFLCQTRGGGKALPDFVDIPKDNYEKNLAIAVGIIESMGIDLANPEKTGFFSMADFGLAGCGKTRWASTFIGLPGITGTVYVAADGDSEALRSCWNEVKQVKETTT